MTKKGAEALRKKVQSVARLMRVFRTLRQQHELIVQLKGVTPGHRIPPGALLKGEEGLKDGAAFPLPFLYRFHQTFFFFLPHSELQRFCNAKQLDSVNERRPEH